MKSIVIDVSDGEAAASDFAWSPDGTRIAVISRLLRRVSVFDIPSGRLAARLEDLAGGASSIAFDANGNVVCGPVDGPAFAATVWDARRGSRHSLPGPSGSPADTAGNMLVEFSVDWRSNRLLGVYQLPAGSSESFAIALYDLGAGAMIQSGGPPAMAATLSPGGTKAAFRARNGSLQIFDLSNGAVVVSVDAHKNGVKATAWSPDGAIVATGGNARAMQRNPQSGLVEVLQDPQTLKLWDAQTGAALGGVELPELVTSISFSPDGRRIAASDGFGAVSVFETRDTTHVISQFPATERQTVVTRFSPDGKWLARLLTATSHIELTDAATGGPH